MNSDRHTASLFAPTYVVRLRPQCGDGIRDLRQFLKAAGRLFGLRCISVTTEQFQASGPRSSRRVRRHSRIGNPRNQETAMDQADRDRLRNFAATTRSNLAFSGVSFISFDWKLGKYQVGKNKTDFTGKEVVADVGYVMDGFREWRDSKPIYYLTRLLDKTIAPIERDECGQTNKALWIDDKDPLIAVTVLPVFDQTTRQVFTLTAAFGERAETGNVVNAFLDHNANRPDGEEELPIVQLNVRSYVKDNGDTGYAMQLDVVGWAVRPEAVLKVSPPPLVISAAPAAPAAPAASNGKTSAAARADSAAKPASADAAKPKRKIAAPTDRDDEIPF